MLLKIDEVVSLTGLSRATIYRLVKVSKFPPPIRPSSQCSRWRMSDIEKWEMSFIDCA